MKTLTFSQMQSISSLPRNYSELAESTKNGEDVVFLKRNTPYVVMLNFERWQRLTDLEQKDDEMKALASIQQSEREYEAGEAKPLTSLAEI